MCSVRRCLRAGRHLSYLHLPLADAARRTWEPSQGNRPPSVLTRLLFAVGGACLQPAAALVTVSNAPRVASFRGSPPGMQ